MEAIVHLQAFVVVHLAFKDCTVKEVLIILPTEIIPFTNKHLFTGICSEKCLNGGKCVQKDTCECSKGYYGLHCEYCKFKYHIND